MQCLALDEHFKHQIKRDFLLQSINSRLNSNLSLNELFREIFNLIGISFKFDHILLIQANRNQITLTQEWKRDPEIDSYFHDEEFLHCCLGKELLHISRQFCHQYQNQQRINLVTIPITVKSEFFGLLVLKTRDCERQLSSPEIENLESIAEQIAIAINFEQKQEFLDELQITSQALSLAIGISLDNIEFIIRGKSNITADIDLRLCRYFGLSEGYFLRLQNAYELMEAKRKLGETLNQIKPLAIL